jgi:hypothetical protein
MGRWSQRRRAGGGPQEIPILHMIDAVLDGDTNAEVLYNGSIEATTIDRTSFSSFPSGFVPDAVVNLTSDRLGLSFGDFITGDTEIRYSDGTPNLLNPDSFPYS